MPMTARDRRVLIIGGIVIAVALVGALLINLTSGGGNEALPSFGPPRSPSTGPSPSSTNQPQPPPAAAGRDPFSVPPGLAPAAPPGSSGSPGGGGGGGGGGGTQTTPPPTLPGNGSSTQIGGHTVVLVSVYPRNGASYAQVEVDGTVYNPVVGAHFAGGQFLLRSTSGGCANFLFGDQSFSLCTNPQK